MTSFISERLFNPASNPNAREAAPCYASPYRRFRSMFDPTATNNIGYNDERTNHHNPTTDPRIHPGPPLTSPRVRTTHDEVADAIVSSMSSSLYTGNMAPSYFAGTASNAIDSSRSDVKREMIRWQVVNDKDAQRGFRMFDGILMSVRDVSSEELFLERMKIAYSAYNAYVSGVIDRSPQDIAKALVRAVSACLTKYFSTQSMLRTNRPFIAKILTLDCPDMFCAHSDFVRSYLFTNASPEDEAIIALAEKVYTENDFEVCSDFETRRPAANENQQAFAHNDGSVGSATERLFEFGTRIAERNILGGAQPSFNTTRNGLASGTESSTLTDDLPFAQYTKNTNGASAANTTAMLILVTDFEALHNFVAYALYLTPTQLSRRYNVNFDSLRRSNATGGGVYLECSRAREARNARKRDSAKAAIRTVIEKKRRERIDAMGERSAACEAALQHHVKLTMERNNDVLCHVLLMLFDKCLSALIDRGFENLNARRGYAVASAKEIGTATIYTGIIDTVGEVSTSLEGHVLEGVVKNSAKSVDSTGTERHCPRFTLPANTITTEVVSSQARQQQQQQTEEETVQANSEVEV